MLHSVRIPLRRTFLVMVITGLVVGGSLLGMTLTAGASGGTGVIPTSISHFTCYTATAPVPTGFGPPTTPIILQNQFAESGFAATVSTVTQHCNPVQKTVGTAANQTVTPIVNPNAHLLCFKLKAAKKQPIYNVSVTNQFGTAQLTTGQPSTLCAPSWKDGPATACNSVPASAPSGCVTLPQAQVQPPGLDHYVCYTAAYTSATTPQFTLPTALQLQDEFMTANLPARLSNPNLLCLPTQKTVVPGIPPVPVVNPDAHLVCFPVSAKITPPSVTDENQFGSGNVTPTKLKELCVPTSKQIIVNGTPTPTTGTLVVTAVDANGIALSGATFQVTGPGGGGTCTTGVTGTTTGTLSGTCDITGLIPGSYDVSQTGAPNGYTMPAGSQTVNVTGAGEATSSFFDIFTE